VIGGSANFTRSADERNAENVTFIASAAIAGQFVEHWQGRRSVSTSWPE
jgi:phosphatidylserine/phosphatidylglycerophosphate/cardiolipin synthase-like enzyme